MAQIQAWVPLATTGPAIGTGMTMAAKGFADPTERMAGAALMAQQPDRQDK